MIFFFVSVCVENGNGSDSDANPDDAPEYYQLISVVDDDGSSDDEHGRELRHVPNGFAVHVVVKNGISSLDLNDIAEKSSSDEEEEQEEEEEERREDFERALREEENRRNAPLTAENTTRVMDVMRRVSFAGVVPDWIGLLEIPMIAGSISFAD